jgi:hypothetical protein
MPLRLLPGVILARGRGKLQLTDAGTAREPGMSINGLCLTGILVLVLGEEVGVAGILVPVPNLVNVLVTGTFTKTVITHKYW